MNARRLSKTVSWTLLVAVTATVVLALLARSQWLNQFVRAKLVDGIQRSTGARAEIGGLYLSAASLTVRLNDVVIHGRESGDEPALFQADSITIHLGLVSVLHRDWYVDSVIIRRPKNYLAIRADGSTNLPAPHKQDPASLLLNLHVHHLQMREGLARVNLQEVRYDLTGSAVRLNIGLNQSRSGYALQTAMDNIDVLSMQQGSRYRLRTLYVSGELQPDKLSLTHLAVQSPIGQMEASGVLSDFANPQVFAHTWGTVDVHKLASFFRLKGAYAGDVQFAGILRKQLDSPFDLRGKLSGANLSARSGSYHVEHAGLVSLVDVNGGGLAFSQLRVSAMGATVTGYAKLSRRGRLDGEGEFHGLVVERVQKLFANTAPTLNSVAAGRVRLSGILESHGRGLVVEGQTNFSPLAGPLPLSGSLAGTASLDGHSIEISDSHFVVAGTQISLEGRVPDSVTVAVDSADLSTLRPLLDHFPKWKEAAESMQHQSSLHVAGEISELFRKPTFDGVVQAANLQLEGQQLTSLQTHVLLQSNSVQISSATVRTPDFTASVAGTASLSDYRPSPSSVLQMQIQASQANVAKLFQRYGGVNLPIIQGVGSASFTFAGSIQDPKASGTVNINSLNAYGQLLNQVRLTLQLDGPKLVVSDGRIEAGAAFLGFSGTYTHGPEKWTNGQLALQARSDGFPLASLSPVRRFVPDLDAVFEVNADLRTGISERGLSPSQLQGYLHIRHVLFKHHDYGDLLFDTRTDGATLSTQVSGDLSGKAIKGFLRTSLSDDFQTAADVQFDEINWADIQRMLAIQTPGLSAEGLIRGHFHAEGPLSDIARFSERVQVDQLQLRASALQPVSIGQLAPPAPVLVFQNKGPLVLSAVSGIAQVDSFHIIGPQTDLTMTGSMGWHPSAALSLNVDGAMNLAILQQWRAGLQSAGSLKISAHAEGTWNDPDITGRAVIENGQLLTTNLANGLTDVNGAIRFDGTRARIEKLQAKSGGGQIDVSGSVTYDAGAPLVYNLQAEAKDTRFRYANAVSVTGNATLRLTGTSQNGLLSGNVTINRAVLNTDADLGNIIASTGAPVPVAQNQRDLLTGLQMDIHIDSSDDLVLSTALSQNVQTDIDLHLRGAPDRPVLLGTITANQGDVKLFGAKYTINRGVINFVNAVKLEPVLDLDLQTETRGIAVDITVSGTPSKLNLNYRSDPPLQPKDIIALLTVGQAPSFTTASVGNAQVTNDTSALQAGANTLLGQAASPVSNRLSKLFGITNIKIDPLVQGITNTPQARLTLEQQVSRDITVTYITNLAETSEQIFRFEWALNPQYSVIAIRDDNGEFGIDLQYRARFGSH